MGTYQGKNRSSQYWDMSCQAVNMSSQARNMSHQAWNMSGQAGNMLSPAGNMSSQAGNMSSQAKNPKDHTLKVSCHYLYFWLKYSFEEVCPGWVGSGWWSGRWSGRVGRVVFYGYKDQPRADQQFQRKNWKHLPSGQISSGSADRPLKAG